MQSLYHMLCLPQRVYFMLMILSQLHLSLLPLSSFSWSARVEKKRKELPHSSSTLKYFLHLYLSYIHPMRCRWPCLLWFVKQIVATCCFVHLYMCIHVFVSICTLLSSKLGDKGGVESLMSCLTGCIHVSLFLPANTCCSVWERHCDATHTLIGGRKGAKKREQRFFVKLDMSGGHYSLVTFKRKISFQSQNIYEFWFDALHWVFQQINSKEVKRAYLTGDHTTTLTQK